MKANETLDILHQRKSIRQFTKEPIPKEDLIEIARAARATPTSVNAQRRKFTLVANQDNIQKLAQAMGKAMGQKDYDLYKPAAILLISSPRGYTYSEIETGLAVQNAYIAATALGLGTVWTDQMRNLSDHPGVRQVLDDFNIPSHHVCFNVLPIGVPAENPPTKERTEEIEWIE